MTRYLCFSITFLDRSFHGRSDNDESEWPPSPMRLFQALLAGAHTGYQASQWSETKVEAFRWLERLEPPAVVTPEVYEGTEYSIAVPNNDSDVPGSFWARGAEPPANKQLSSLRTVKKVCPVRLGSDTIYYLWQLGDGKSATKHAEELCQEARHMLALGWGIDQVVGSGQILDEAAWAALPGKRWRPWMNAFRPGAKTLRVPKSGSLEDLENVHQSFLHRLDGNIFHPPLKLSQFDTVVYLSASTLPPRSFAKFELPDGVSFRQENAAKAAAMLRSLTCDHAKLDAHNFPGGTEAYVAGHAGQQDITPPRFSYLPLPSIGGEHADGMVRRMIIAEPFGEDGRQAKWAQQRLLGATLVDKDGNERGRLLDSWRQTSRAMFDRYTGESQGWCTVTPVILPGFDDKSQEKAEKLLFVAVRQAGLPVEALSDVTLRKSPFFPGAQHPREYFTPGYLKGKPGWHVRLTFCEPVSGPLAVGAGRHIGLGIFARSEA